MRIPPHIVIVLLTAGARGTLPVAERWQLEVVGPATTERGELRIEDPKGRLLLESDDTAFQVLERFHDDGVTIGFTVPHDRRRFEGRVTGTLMQGVVHNPDGTTSGWNASRMPTTSAYWPVPPRVTVRQLELGSPATSLRISGAWVAALVDTVVLEREYRQLAVEAGMTPADGARLEERPRRMALGLDADGRAAARRLMSGVFTRFISEPSAASLFHRQDLSDVLLDMHDRASVSGSAIGYRIRGLRLLGGNQAGDDTSAIREAAWQTWEHAQQDSVWKRALLDTLSARDDGASREIRSMLSQYTTASEWWPDALHWLLTRPWIDTPSGPRSPAALVAAFWGVDSLPLPAIEPQLFGNFTALPVPGITALGARFVIPRNASAREWLGQGGTAIAIDTWREIQFGWPEPLPLTMGRRSLVVNSPSGEMRTHDGAFFASKDAIRIDPGIVPILAVVTVIHEWQHLLLSSRRLQGASPGVVNSRSQLRLREADPWLAEGAAEWITEQILKQARGMAPLLAFLDAEKRLAIGSETPEDPHALGYRLVRAAAERAHSRAEIRVWLLRYLADPAGLARVAGLAGRGKVPPMILKRPATAVVIPEVTFTWDDGVADRVTHRLIIPTRPSEH